jgi:hypothetical protein
MELPAHTEKWSRAGPCATCRPDGRAGEPHRVVVCREGQRRSCQMTVGVPEVPVDGARGPGDPAQQWPIAVLWRQNFQVSGGGSSVSPKSQAGKNE